MFDNPEHAFGGSQRMLELINSIYAAVGKPELWTGVLDEIGKAMESDSIGFFAGAPDATKPALLAMTNIDPAAWKAFETYYATINPIMSIAERKLSPNQVWISEEVISDAELMKTEFYADFFKPNRMHYSLGLRLIVEDGPTASFTCQRPLTWGPFPEAAKVMSLTLKPHLQRALTLHHRMGAMEAGTAGLEAALNAFERAVFGLGRDGRVMFCNGRAEAMVQAGDCLRLIQGRLSAISREQNRRLQRLFSEAINVGAGVDSGNAMLVERRTGENPLQVTVTPFVSSIAGRSAQVAALVFVNDPASRAGSRAGLLRTLYELTPAEARIADLLLQGLDTREAAQELGLKVETVRLQTKKVLAKTGTRRQAELMKLGLSLPGTGGGDRLMG